MTWGLSHRSPAPNTQACAASVPLLWSVTPSSTLEGGVGVGEGGGAPFSPDTPHTAAGGQAEDVPKTARPHQHRPRGNRFLSEENLPGCFSYSSHIH